VPMSTPESRQFIDNENNTFHPFPHIETLQSEGASESDKDQAFKKLYDKYCKEVEYVCSRVARSPELTQDAMQETFFKIYKNIASYESDRANFRTWILTIAHNTAVDLVRRTFSQEKHQIRFYPIRDFGLDGFEGFEGFEKFDEYHLETSSPAPDPLRVVLIREGIREQIGTLEQISPRGKQIIGIFMRTALGYEQSEIAQELGLTASNVSQIISRTRKALIAEIT
jgi:RNA polymerase sigma factor (sigma-70 family)